MNREEFAKRLTELMSSENKTARELSLALGQNPGYINAICAQKAYPSMEVFFNICEELNITPLNFFDLSTANHSKINELLPYLKEINEDEFENISLIIKALAEK